MNQDFFKQNYNAVAAVLREGDFLQLNRGVEVGVRAGLFSGYLLEQFPELTMNCVDPYEPYQDIDQWYDEELQGRIMIEAFNRLEPFNDRVVWCLQSSAAAVRTFEPRSVDFVFIDANHKAEEVRKDIAFWAPIVRPGGLLCGHDYDIPGVREAVNKWARINKAEVRHIGQPADVWFVGV